MYANVFSTPNRIISILTHERIDSLVENVVLLDWLVNFSTDHVLGQRLYYENYIQLWDMSASSSSSSSSVSFSSLSSQSKPKLAALLRHSCGTALQMKWCPLGAWQPPSSSIDDQVGLFFRVFSSSFDFNFIHLDDCTCRALMSAI
jgi:hypothetical protein